MGFVNPTTRFTQPGASLVGYRHIYHRPTSLLRVRARMIDAFCSCCAAGDKKGRNEGRKEGRRVSDYKGIFQGRWLFCMPSQEVEVIRDMSKD